MTVFKYVQPIYRQNYCKLIENFDIYNFEVRMNEGTMKNVPSKIFGSQNSIQPLPTLLQLCAIVAKYLYNSGW